MKPLAIFRYARTEGPGHFATFLTAHRLAWELVCLDQDDPVPGDPTRFAGLGFMGGPMSANDEYPWTEPVLELMRRAVDARIPVIGHCLGGQMLSRAVGGTVSRAPVKEIGWVAVKAEPTAAARAWLGADRTGFDAFEWHEDTFTIPPGATRILTGATCENQAYVLDERHLGMQCHVEVDAALIETWCRTGAREIEESCGGSPAVQQAATILAQVPDKLPALTAAANALYGRWIEGLKA